MLTIVSIVAPTLSAWLSAKRLEGSPVGKQVGCLPVLPT
nr:MAG TPA: hypothetical protein [Herelleviridae sp.]